MDEAHCVPTRFTVEPLLNTESQRALGTMCSTQGAWPSAGVAFQPLVQSPLHTGGGKAETSTTQEPRRSERSVMPGAAAAQQR